LDQPWIITLRTDYSERRIPIRQSRLTKLHPVKEIENFHPELYPEALSDLRRFEEREVPIRDSGAS
jgi:hypothetical protein